MNKLCFETTTDVRNDFARSINRVEFAGETIILMRRGRAIVKLTAVTDDDHARIKATHPEMYE